MISSAFAEDADCTRLFLNAKDMLKKNYVLVVVGKDKKWENTDVGMRVGKQVYIDMTESKQCHLESKFEEFAAELKKKLDSLEKAAKPPQCFISYCWMNSHDAVAKGAKKSPSALGWQGGDPRNLMTELQKSEITYWIDTERAGVVSVLSVGALLLPDEFGDVCVGTFSAACSRTSAWDCRIVRLWWYAFRRSTRSQ